MSVEEKVSLFGHRWQMTVNSSFKTFVLSVQNLSLFMNSFVVHWWVRAAMQQLLPGQWKEYGGQFLVRRHKSGKENYHPQASKWSLIYISQLWTHHPLNAIFRCQTGRMSSRTYNFYTKRYDKLCINGDWCEAPGQRLCVCIYPF